MQKTKNRFKLLSLFLAVLLCITAVLPFINTLKSTSADTENASSDMTFENGAAIFFEQGAILMGNNLVLMAKLSNSALNSVLDNNSNTWVQFTTVALSNTTILDNANMFGFAIPTYNDNDDFIGYYYNQTTGGNAFNKLSDTETSVVFIYLPLKEELNQDEEFDISISFVWFGGTPDEIAENDFSASIKNASLNRLLNNTDLLSGQIAILKIENERLMYELASISAEYDLICKENSEQKEELKYKDELEQSIFEKNAIISAREEQIRKLQEEINKLKNTNNVTCASNVDFVVFTPAIFLICLAVAIIGGKRYAKGKEKKQLS